MIPALIDWISYRMHWRHYSSNALMRGGSLLDSDALHLLERVKGGDLVFLHTRDSNLSWAVMYYISSVWGHVATSVGGGKVIHATTSGMAEHPLSLFCNGRDYYTVYTLDQLTDEQRAGVAESAAREIGKQYNWAGVGRKWLRIVIGSDYRWRPQYSLDILCLLALGLTARTSSLIFNCSVAAISLYLSLLIANLPRRKKYVVSRDNPFNIFGGQRWEQGILVPDR